MSEPPKFSWVGCAIVAGLINFVVNAPQGWIPKVPMPIWGNGSFTGELIGTAFGVGLFTSIIATAQIRGAVAKGKMLPPDLSERWRNFFVRWPRFWLWRALTVGFVTVLLFVPLPLLVIYLLDPDPLDRLDIVLLKAFWAAFVGALITPTICAAATYPPQQKRGGSHGAPARESVPSDGESLPTANP